MKQYRQGDVFIRSVDKLPDGVKQVQRDNGRVILAYGEVTGHAHAIEDRGATIYENPGVDDRFLILNGPATIVHEEHGTIALDPGVYQVNIQREYSPADLSRRVLD